MKSETSVLQQVEEFIRPLVLEHTPEGTEVQAVVDQWIHAIATDRQLYCDRTTTDPDQLRIDVEFALSINGLFENRKIFSNKLFGCSNIEKVDMGLLSSNFGLVSMFTGVGGLDMGFEGGFQYKDEFFEKQPFSTLAAYEKDEKCVETIKRNLSIPIQQLELSEELAEGFPSADILIGGFPCQDFSSCGPKKGLSSDRGQLYKVLVRYMQHHRPKIVCAENVPNLARMQKGAVLETIVKDFEDQGYKVQVWDLFAPDYGVPQSRRRLFFICTRNDLIGEPVKPVPKFTGKHRGTKWAIGDLEKVTDETISNQSQYFKASKAKKGNGQGDEHCKANEPSYTIRANAKSRVQFHYELERRLTIRECARLQTFPDSFVFPHSATSNVMQIGNAVPPMLSYAVASSIRDYLKEQG